MMVRDKHVDPAAPRQVYLRRAAGPAVGGDDQRPPLARRALDCPQRQPVAISQPLRHVGRHVQAERPQRQHQDREPRQPVRVEVAVDEDALAPCPRLRHSPESGLGVGEQPGVVQTVLGRGEEPSQLIGRRHAPRRQQRQQPPRNVPLRGQRRALRIDSGSNRDSPVETGDDHAAQDDTTGSTAAYPRLTRVDLHRCPVACLNLHRPIAIRRCRPRRRRAPQRAHLCVRERRSASQASLA